MDGEKGMEVRYCICKHCGNIVEKVKDKGVPVICCGEPMQELKAGVTDAAVEKHVPVYTVEGNHVHVVVGETKHPMLEEDFIEWITSVSYTHLSWMNIMHNCFLIKKWKRLSF